MAKEAESMNKQHQANLILDMRHVGNDLADYSHLAFHIELNDHTDTENRFWTEQVEEQMIKMMKLIKRYNDEVKELVR